MPPTQQSGMQSVAVIDDNIIVRHCWKQAIKPWGTASFASPEDFWQAHPPNMNLDQLYRCIIIDHHYGAGHSDGFDFANTLRARYTGPIFLSSDSQWNQIPTSISRTLPKDTMSQTDLLKLIETVGGNSL